MEYNEDRPGTATSAGPIGVFDSGVGGLTILKELRRELPNESFVYFGDTGHCPYGYRSEPDIQQLALAAVSFLRSRGARAIVVACNTASQAALSLLRATYDFPFVGVVPPVKPAVAQSRSGRVGVATTELAAHSPYLHDLIARYGDGAQVYAVGCQPLVALVEAGQLRGEIAARGVHACLRPLLEAGIDTLALGCTHFPALREVIQQVVGPEVAVIDSGAAVARQTRRVLVARGLLRPLTDAPPVHHEFWCSGDPVQFSAAASLVLGEQVVALRGAEETGIEPRRAQRFTEEVR
jgi:glutamate racemase